jgi:transposase
MDNLGSHKANAIRQALKAVGAKLIYLPAYSPDLNPIEQVFSKLKHFLRKAKARTFTDISDRIADIIKGFSPSERINDLLNAGYCSV